MRIGELAHSAGVAVDTVRYYERLGLMPPPVRTGAGYRDYAEDDRQRLHFIRNAKELGFTLEEIHELVRLLADERQDRRRVRELADARLRQIEAHLAELEAVRRSLHRVASQCSGTGPLAGCPIVEAVMAHRPPPPVDGNRRVQPGRPRTSRASAKRGRPS